MNFDGKSYWRPGQMFLCLVLSQFALSCVGGGEADPLSPPASSALTDAATDGSTDGLTGTCAESTLFIPDTVPSIFVLADGSGSMFQSVSPGNPSTHWTVARDAILSLVGAFPERAFWGLGQFRGLPTPFASCASVTVTPAAMGNLGPITTDYATGPAADRKLEGPITDVLPMVPSYLAGMGGAGPKILILATAAEPDFCDDESTVCPLDGAIAGIRNLALQGIKTLVVGQPSAYNVDACPGALRSYANAGASMPIAAPCPGRGIFAECASNPGWKALASAAGRSNGPALVDYAATSGSANAYSYSAADQAALATTIGTVVPGPKSCIFDLATIPTTKPFPFDDQGRMDTLKVGIAGAAGTDDAQFDKGLPDGWTKVSRTEIEIHGASCSMWKDYVKQQIRFALHCVV